MTAGSLAARPEADHINLIKDQVGASGWFCLGRLIQLMPTERARHIGGLFLPPELPPDCLGQVRTGRHNEEV